MAKEPKEYSRRDFLKTSGGIAGGFIGGSLLGGLVGFNLNDGEDGVIEEIIDTDEQSQGEEKNTLQEARIFFKNPLDFEVLSAATEKIYPEDDNGPGAIGLGVPFFIDKQLAGNYGSNEKFYMEGPFEEGENPLTNGDLIMLGLRTLNSKSKEDFDENFHDLSEYDQIKLLEDMENDDIEMEYAPASAFFAQLHALTLQGAYADPLYGGNKNMEGWKMKEWPGAQTSYRHLMEEDAPSDLEFEAIEPISLSHNM